MNVYGCSTHQHLYIYNNLLVVNKVQNLAEYGIQTYMDIHDTDLHFDNLYFCIIQNMRGNTSIY